MDCTQLLTTCTPPLELNPQESSKEIVATLTVNGVVFDIFNCENTVGRGDSCSIRIKNEAISNQHAIIEANEFEEHFIYDLGSTNRTKLGKTILKPNVRYFLNDGDCLSFADLGAVYKYVIKPELSKTTSSFCVPETPVKNERSGLISDSCSKDLEIIESSDNDIFDEPFEEMQPNNNSVLCSPKCDEDSDPDGYVISTQEFENITLAGLEKKKTINSIENISSSDRKPNISTGTGVVKCEVINSDDNSKVEDQSLLDIYDMPTQTLGDDDPLLKPLVESSNSGKNGPNSVSGDSEDEDTLDPTNYGDDIREVDTEDPRKCFDIATADTGNPTKCVDVPEPDMENPMKCVDICEAMENPTICVGLPETDMENLMKCVDTYEAITQNCTILEDLIGNEGDKRTEEGKNNQTLVNEPNETCTVSRIETDPVMNDLSTASTSIQQDLGNEKGSSTQIDNENPVTLEKAETARYDDTEIITDTEELNGPYFVDQIRRSSSELILDNTIKECITSSVKDLGAEVEVDNGLDDMNGGFGRKAILDMCTQELLCHRRDSNSTDEEVFNDTSTNHSKGNEENINFESLSDSTHGNNKQIEVAHDTLTPDRDKSLVICERGGEKSDRTLEKSSAEGSKCVSELCDQSGNSSFGKDNLSLSVEEEKVNYREKKLKMSQMMNLSSNSTKNSSGMGIELNLSLSNVLTESVSSDVHQSIKEVSNSGEIEGKSENVPVKVKDISDAKPFPNILSNLTLIKLSCSEKSFKQTASEEKSPDGKFRIVNKSNLLNHPSSVDSKNDEVSKQLENLSSEICSNNLTKPISEKENSYNKHDMATETFNHKMTEPALASPGIDIVRTEVDVLVEGVAVENENEINISDMLTQAVILPTKGDSPKENSFNVQGNIVPEDKFEECLPEISSSNLKNRTPENKETHSNDKQTSNLDLSLSDMMTQPVLSSRDSLVRRETVTNAQKNEITRSKETLPDIELKPNNLENQFDSNQEKHVITTAGQTTLESSELDMSLSDMLTQPVSSFEKIVTLKNRTVNENVCVEEENEVSLSEMLTQPVSSFERIVTLKDRTVNENVCVEEENEVSLSEMLTQPVVSIDGLKWSRERICFENVAYSTKNLFNKVMKSPEKKCEKNIKTQDHQKHSNEVSLSELQTQPVITSVVSGPCLQGIASNSSSSASCLISKAGDPCSSSVLNIEEFHDNNDSQSNSKAIEENGMNLSDMPTQPVLTSANSCINSSPSRNSSDTCFKGFGNDFEATIPSSALACDKQLLDMNGSRSNCSGVSLSDMLTQPVLTAVHPGTNLSPKRGSLESCVSNKSVNPCQSSKLNFKEFPDSDERPLTHKTSVDGDMSLSDMLTQPVSTSLNSSSKMSSSESCFNGFSNESEDSELACEAFSVNERPSTHKTIVDEDMSLSDMLTQPIILQNEKNIKKNFKKQKITKEKYNIKRKAKVIHQLLNEGSFKTSDFAAEISTCAVKTEVVYPNESKDFSDSLTQPVSTRSQKKSSLIEAAPLPTETEKKVEERLSQTRKTTPEEKPNADSDIKVGKIVAFSQNITMRRRKGNKIQIDSNCLTADSSSNLDSRSTEIPEKIQNSSNNNKLNTHSKILTDDHESAPIIKAKDSKDIGNKKESITLPTNSRCSKVTRIEEKNNISSKSESEIKSTDIPSLNKLTESLTDMNEESENFPNPAPRRGKRKRTKKVYEDFCFVEDVNKKTTSMSSNDTEDSAQVENNSDNVNKKSSRVSRRKRTKNENKSQRASNNPTTSKEKMSSITNTVENPVTVSKENLKVATRKAKSSKKVIETVTSLKDVSEENDEKTKSIHIENIQNIVTGESSSTSNLKRSNRKLDKKNDKMMKEINRGSEKNVSGNKKKGKINLASPSKAIEHAEFGRFEISPIVKLRRIDPPIRETVHTGGNNSTIATNVVTPRKRLASSVSNSTCDVSTSSGFSTSTPNVTHKEKNVKKRRLNDKNRNQSEDDSLSCNFSSPSRRSPRKRLIQRPSSSKENVMFTGYSDSKAAAFIKRIGGDVVDCPNTCSVLVTDKVRRTVKFLCALALGRPILKSQWITECKKSNSFISHDQFLLKDEEAEKQYSFCLKESITKASNTKLLEGKTIYVTCSVKPSPAEMKIIIECCGGTSLLKKPRKWPPNSICVSCTEDKSVWNDIKKNKIPLVSAEFILTGILQQTCDIDKYSL